MKLYYSPASPFVRKVMVVIEECGLSDQVELITTATTPVATDAALKAANPLGKLPALLREDGPAVYDSRVITRYLNDEHGGALYPAARIWDVLTLEATADGLMEAAVLMVYEHRVRPADKVFDDWIEAQWSKAFRAVQTINDRWMGHLAGPVDAGQIAVGCALGYLDYRHGDRDWRTQAPDLAAWYAKFAQRASMAGTAPPEA
ncbi:Glutathione S-transferase [Pseudooceanicola batsensis HTCC2597]|uniref:Glutathione S-transferase n=1 Tax=Pseudooceanicola batsensis (strain ATCC BAA-863 / DSM 15984 / KCTC 12145 / HTCC2597) TaxID=252305 RepID=A3U3Z3_PSEBH|nr:glutathione S-transferase [Pseudooceanicola batsensis]EAQ01129.1 Glutathione S-transferase [Pseudooceanicola batsensis HTCC2597]